MNKEKRYSNMDYEQKYKEALARAKSKLHHPDKPCYVDVVEIFPELKESEDEQIRKAIISHFVSMTTSCTEEEIQRRKYIAWLENQKSVEWSEMDESNRQETLYFIRQFQQSNKCKDEGDMQNSVTCEKWLESLKPQNHWKPTKQQMEAIKHVAEQNRASEIGNILDNLLVEIKNM